MGSRARRTELSRLLCDCRAMPRAWPCRFLPTTDTQSRYQYQHGLASTEGNRLVSAPLGRGARNAVRRSWHTSNLLVGRTRHYAMACWHGCRASGQSCVECPHCPICHRDGGLIAIRRRDGCHSVRACIVGHRTGPCNGSDAKQRATYTCRRYATCGLHARYRQCTEALTRQRPPRQRRPRGHHNRIRGSSRQPDLDDATGSPTGSHEAGG